MIATVADIRNHLREAGFRKVTVQDKETPGTASVKITGFGRFWKLTAPEVEKIRQEKPIALSMKISRKFLGFRLWEVEV